METKTRRQTEYQDPSRICDPKVQGTLEVHVGPVSDSCSLQYFPAAKPGSLFPQRANGNCHGQGCLSPVWCSRARVLGTLKPSQDFTAHPWLVTDSGCSSDVRGSPRQPVPAGHPTRGPPFQVFSMPLARHRATCTDRGVAGPCAPRRHGLIICRTNQICFRTLTKTARVSLQTRFYDNNQPLVQISSPMLTFASCLQVSTDSLCGPPRRFITSHHGGEDKDDSCSHASSCSGPALEQHIQSRWQQSHFWFHDELALQIPCQVSPASTPLNATWHHDDPRQHLHTHCCRVGSPSMMMPKRKQGDCIRAKPFRRRMSTNSKPPPPPLCVKLASI